MSDCSKAEFERVLAWSADRAEKHFNKVINDVRQKAFDACSTAAEKAAGRHGVTSAETAKPWLILNAVDGMIYDAYVKTIVKIPLASPVETG